MTRKAVAPTKSNYLEMQDSLEHAQRGYDLLERKRQILVMELTDKMEAARRAQERVRDAMEKAYGSLRSAARADGVERLLREAVGIRPRHHVKIKSRSVMGVTIPEISCQCEPQGIPFGLLGGAAGVDEVCERFHDALEAIIDLAELENAVMRLAHEVKRTRRRVNALENTFIPQYEETLNFIEDALEEREREEIVIMKKVKGMHRSVEESLQGEESEEQADG